MLIMAIGISSYEIFFKTQRYDADKILATVPSNAIRDYLRQNADEFDLDITANKSDVNNVNIDTRHIGDEEIIQYLNEAGWDTSDYTN